MSGSGSLGRFLGAALGIAALLLAPGAGAADKIIAGTLGGQAPLWPFYVGVHKGIFAAEGIDLEINFAPTSSGVVQQLTAGSLDVLVSVGITDPVLAIEKGASLAIIRIIGDSAPYALIAKPTVKSIDDLKGKTISIGQVSDVTFVYIDRMLRAHGLKKGDYDLISAGVAAARFAALQAGVADAAMVLPPLNFHADKLGFHTIGLPVDYVNDFPFTCMAVYKPWAVAHVALVERLLAATSKSMDWLYDPANHQAALDLLVEVAHASPEDAAASFEFLQRINYFERSGKVSRARLENLIAVEKTLGYIDTPLTVERLILPGVTALKD